MTNFKLNFDHIQETPETTAKRGRHVLLSRSSYATMRIVTGLLSGNYAVAQEQSTREVSRTLERVVATARKKEESLQEVPISISVLTFAALERSVLRSIDV